MIFQDIGCSGISPGAPAKNNSASILAHGFGRGAHTYTPLEHIDVDVDTWCKSMGWDALQVSVNRQGVPDATMHAMRLLTAPPALYGQHQPTDFAKQVDPLNEEAALQVSRFWHNFMQSITVFDPARRWT